MQRSATQAPLLVLRSMVALAPRLRGEPHDIAAIDRRLVSLDFQRRELQGGAIAWAKAVANSQSEALPLTVMYDPNGRDVEPAPDASGTYYIVAWCGTVINPWDRPDTAEDRDEHNRILHSRLLSRLFHVGSIDHAYRVRSAAAI